MAAIRQQVVLIGRPNALYQAPAQLLLKEAHHRTYFLKREPASSQITNNGDLRQIVERVDAPMSLARCNYDLLLVPPLQLP
jgi:hypothetical protein